VLDLICGYEESADSASVHANSYPVIYAPEATTNFDSSICSPMTDLSAPESLSIRPSTHIVQDVKVIISLLAKPNEWVIRCILHHESTHDDRGGCRGVSGFEALWTLKQGLLAGLHRTRPAREHH
jgi:hypothetical protein